MSTKKPSRRVNMNRFPRVDTQKGMVNLIKQARIPLDDAVHLTRSLAVGYPDLSVAMHVHCRPDDASIRDIRGTSILPHNFMRTRTLVLAEGTQADEARRAGADVVGGEEMVVEILEGRVEFDRVICTPDMVRALQPAARILGPRGIMPTVKKGMLCVCLPWGANACAAC